MALYFSRAGGLDSTTQELTCAVQELSLALHELRDSTVSCFQLLNESIKNLARKIPSPTPSPPQQPGTNVNISLKNKM